MHFRVHRHPEPNRFGRGASASASPLTGRWSKYLIAPDPLAVHSHVMKATPTRKALTLGEFIVSVYDALGRQRAKGTIRLAINAHVIAFRGQRHLVVS